MWKLYSKIQPDRKPQFVGHWMINVESNDYTINLSSVIFHTNINGIMSERGLYNSNNSLSFYVHFGVEYSLT